LITNAVKDFLLAETSNRVVSEGLELKLSYFNCFAILQGIYNVQIFFISDKSTSFENFNYEINNFLETNNLKYLNNYFKYPDLNDLLNMFSSNILPHLLEYIIFKLRGFKYEDTKYTILLTQTQTQSSPLTLKFDYDCGYKYQGIYKHDLETFISIIKQNQFTNNEAIELISLLNTISKIKNSFPIENEIRNLLYLLLISNSDEHINKLLLHEILIRVLKHYKIISKFNLSIFGLETINADNVWKFITNLKLLIINKVQTQINTFYTNEFKKLYEKEIQLECINRVIEIIIILFEHHTLLSQRLIKVFIINNLTLIDLDVIHTFVSSKKMIKDYEAFFQILIKLGLVGSLDELKLQFSDIKLLKYRITN